MSFDATSFPFLRLRFGALRVPAQAFVLSFGLFVFAPTGAAAQDAPQSEDAIGEQAAPAAPSLEDTELPNPTSEGMDLGIPEEVEAEGSETAPASWDVSSPCENVQHPYEADLCLQRRMAEAAEETAQAAERGLRLSRLLMLIGLAATLLLLLVFVSLLMAAFAARRAARAASSPRSEGAQDHGKNENEVRAYVDVDSLEFIETPESDGIVKVKLNFRNSGQTPALKLRSIAEVGIRDISDEDLLPVMPLPELSSFDPARPRLGRDATATEIVSCESPPKLADRVTNGDATILVWGVVEYTDVFDGKRKTTFQYLCNDETLDTGQIFKPMVRGDEDG